MEDLVAEEELVSCSRTPLMAPGGILPALYEIKQAALLMYMHAQRFK